MKHMMRTGIVLFVVSVLTATAQSRPDFSGVWRRVDAPAPGTLPGLPAPSKQISTTIAQSATEITVEHRSEREGRQEVLTYTYKLDGSESVNKVGNAVHRTTAAWKGEALVLTSFVPFEGQSDWRITDVYRMENGHLVVENTTVNFRGTFSAKRVYKKD